MKLKFKNFEKATSCGVAFFAFRVGVDSGLTFALASNSVPGESRDVKTIELMGRPYNIYQDGTVESLPYENSYNGTKVGMKLKPSVRKNGYTSVPISRDGKTKSMLTHRVVARAFLPDYSEELDVDHIDGDRTNNHASNLRMASRSDNLKGHHAKREGTSQYRGITYDRKNKKWRVKVKSHGKLYCGGRHTSEREAALAWNVLATQHGFKKEAMNEV